MNNGITDMDTFFDVEESTRNELLSVLSKEKIYEISKFANRYPSMEMEIHH
jgi:hypothetical protein